MELIEARVHNFKSIDDSEVVKIDPNVTIIVGQNESGKTAFLQAMNKANSIENGVLYNYVEEYPRKGLNDYEPLHEKYSTIVAELSYELSDKEIQQINEDLEFDLLCELTFKVSYKYNGGKSISLDVNENIYLSHIIGKSLLTAEVARIVNKCPTLYDFMETLEV